MASPQFVVSTKFTAKDRVSSVLKKMGKSSDKFGDKAQRNFNKASKAANGFGKITKGILAAGAIQKGVTLLTSGISQATEEFINFDHAVLSASAKFKGLDLTTQKGIKTFEKLKNTAREVGATTEFTATQAAQGLEFLSLAGFNAEQAIAALPGTVNLATAASIDLGRATDIATDSLGAFGLMTKDAAQLQTNLTRVNDVMAKTMATSNTSIEQMFEAVASGAADFTQAGQSMETFAALTGIMANSGKKGESAGTALRNVMVRLAAPTGEAAKILDRLNVKTQDSAGNFRDVIDILGDFQKGLKGMGSAQKTSLISTVFGLRAQGAINILLKSGAKNMKAYREELEGAGGASQKMADIMRSSLLNKLKSLQSALIELSFKVLAEFRDQGVGTIEDLTKAIRELDPKPLVDGIKEIIVVMKDLNDLMQPIIAGFKFLSKVGEGPVGRALSAAVNPIALQQEARNLGQGIGGLFGGENSSNLPVVQALAPNQREAGAKAQANQFSGTINFNHPPPGTTYTQGAGPTIQTSGLGTQ